MAEGNGAKEKLRQYVLERWGIEEDEADMLLVWLWTEGYALTPVPRDEGDEEDALPDAAIEKPEGATIYPLNLFRRRPHP